MSVQEQEKFDIDSGGVIKKKNFQTKFLYI